MVISEHEISILDFKSHSSSCIRFPSDGSTESRATYTEMEWISYCPDVFRILQEYGKIDAEDYMASICSQETLRQLHSHGKSNSLLYLSDDRYAIKILSKPDMKGFLEKLPNYYHHVRKYRNTLLTKFYGLHVVKQSGGQKIYFVVMGNVLRSDLYIHKRYDLKAYQGRSMNKAGVDEGIKMDDDLDIFFRLDTSTRNQILMQIKHDCNFLEDIGVIDYSLLLGIHLFTKTQSDSLLRGPCSPARSSASDDTKSISSHDSCSQSDLDQDSSRSSVDDPQLPCYIETETKLGVRVGARAIRNQRHGMGSLASNPAKKSKGNNVTLFFEITNILQDYNMAKRMENVFKSLHFDSQLSSGGNPKSYSARFQDLIGQIFPDNDSCSAML